ncbi:serine/threonine-protein kinase [Luteipulveratus mongoliensis]|uniref:serine/threonine-protein kinase n=1 Tax=Luteipulveratus mongoliensis TaxID=571913 RepID=UPI000696BADB|nr:serine/threonine-protein kinase [Luteipulveratus mongoliensis]
MVRELHPGEAFAGYRIRRVLGRGGMGAVYAADHPRLPRLVAIKTLTASTDDAEARARFEREAEMVARLDHPNIVAVLDRGIEDGLPWISMQLVDGTDASRALREHGPYPLGRVLHVVHETARALDEAHRRGVLHRDVKPGNIMLRAGQEGGAERVLLTDFGIGSVAGGDEITQTGGSMATVEYASPEQLRGELLDGRSDQYSLACTTFTLLAGRPPFQGPPVRVIEQHLQAAPPSLLAARPDLPPALQDVVHRAMSKDRTRRFATCAEYADALRATTAPKPVLAPAPPPSHRARWLGAGAAVAAVAVAATVIVVTTRHDAVGQSPTSSTTTPAAPTSPSEDAIWQTAQPAIKLWPDLLPAGPKAKGYQNGICTPTTTPPASSKVPFRYKLQCVAREEGFDKPTVQVDLLSFAPGKAADALKALTPPTSVPVVPGLRSGHDVRLYHFEDPVDGTWVLVEFKAADRRDYQFQVSGKGMSYSQLYDWIAAAPL